MSGYLRYGGFKWLKDVDNFNVNSISENSSTAYILEVDIEYLEKLQKLHSDYPLAPEKLAIPYEIMSNYCKKFIPSLGGKTNYVVYYRNLQLYLSLGMKLTEIHRVLKFTQSDWMKKYIGFNTEKRKNATNSFKKYFLS